MGGRAGVLVDLTPLRASADFRRLWLGQAVSFTGSTITSAALPYQVYEQTGSSPAVGALGLAQLVPLLALSLLGGGLADRHDKRGLLLLTLAGALLCPAALALNSSLDRPALWPLFVVGAASSGALAISSPVIRSMLPLLLPPELRPAGYALQATYGTFGMMAGPAVAGLLIAAFGLTTAYVVDAATYALALVLFVGLAPSPPVGEGPTARMGGSILEGLRFLRGHRVVMSVFAIDLCAMVFGMPKALFPALAERLGGGAQLYGLLVAAVAGGAFVASLTSGWAVRVRRQGRAVLWCVAAWGAAIAVVGVVRSAPLALLFLALAGAADMISGIQRSAIAADLTPDELRGRVSGVELAVYAGGPALGDLEAGVVGGVVGVPFAIASGGVACVAAAAAFAVAVPSFARYEAVDRVPARAGEPEPPVLAG